MLSRSRKNWVGLALASVCTYLSIAHSHQAGMLLSCKHNIRLVVDCDQVLAPVHGCPDSVQNKVSIYLRKPPRFDYADGRADNYRSYTRITATERKACLEEMDLRVRRCHNQIAHLAQVCTPTFDGSKAGRSPVYTSSKLDMARHAVRNRQPRPIKKRRV